MHELDEGIVCAADFLSKSQTFLILKTSFGFQTIIVSINRVKENRQWFV